MQSNNGISGNWRTGGSSAQRAFHILAPLAAVSVYVFICYHFGLSKFSPDSWSYYELSLTIFTDEPYRFLTLRSYATERVSAAFPMGWPVVLATAGLVVGHLPMAAPILNAFIAGATIFLSGRIWRNDRTKNAAAIFSSLALAAYPGYADEIISGRAIPLAILLAVIAAGMASRNRYCLAGVAMGLAAVARFDFLVFGAIAILALALSTGRIAASTKAAIGFGIGASPWIIFSIVNFGSAWQSDNSWVAISAAPAFVLDWPASATETIFSDFSLWLARILENTKALAANGILSAKRYPAITALICLLVFAVKIRDRRRLWQILVISGAVTGMGAPYVLSGYMDSRYFAAPLFALSLIVIRQSSSQAMNHFAISMSWSLAMIISAIQVGFLLHTAVALDPQRKTPILDQATCLGDLLSEANQPVVIHRKHGALAFAIAPLTGNKIIILPSNFAELGDDALRDWNNQFGRYRVLTDAEIASCR